jgi:hypothetical protein
MSDVIINAAWAWVDAHDQILALSREAAARPCLRLDENEGYVPCWKLRGEGGCDNCEANRRTWDERRAIRRRMGGLTSALCRAVRRGVEEEARAEAAAEVAWAARAEARAAARAADAAEDAAEEACGPTLLEQMEAALRLLEEE